MHIRNHARTLALSSMLTLSILSPLATHVYADSNQGSGSGSGSPQVTCGTMDGDKDVYSGQSYKDGGTVSAGTEVYRTGEPKVQICSSDGTWHDIEGRVLQPGSLFPVAPHPVGAAVAP